MRMGSTSIRNMVLAAFLFLLFPCSLSAEEEGKAEKAGDIICILIPATAYATTLVVGDKEGRSQFYRSFLTNLGVTYALKFVINKPRPENNGHYSFPSAHTSVAFQGATFIHRRYGLRYSIPAYLGAAFVGWSRVEGESHKHDFTDVAAGAAIGILSSYCFTERYDGLDIEPIVGNGFYGVSLSKNW
jgi:hypothetical protein